MRSILAAATALAPAALMALAGPVATPAAAQVQDRVVIIYGDDPCPSSNGQGIVVCARKPETERYRIPKALRDNDVTPSEVAWANRAQDLEYVGANGTQSCSASGSGGWTGCMKQILADAHAEHVQKKKQENAIPR